MMSQLRTSHSTTVIHSSSPTEIVADGLCSVKLSFTVFQYSSCSIAERSFLKMEPLGASTGNSRTYVFASPSTCPTSG